ncbi:hypothetical protein G7046_g3471 [Stylonectria norvegica]|nr:hypothetical protein G7046_g3471 [Stylonectria norvegica]
MAANFRRDIESRHFGHYHYILSPQRHRRRRSPEILQDGCICEGDQHQDPVEPRVRLFLLDPYVFSPAMTCLPKTSDISADLRKLAIAFSKATTTFTEDALEVFDFWGPASNFGIPIAAILDTQKSPDLISGQMTGALTVYAATFMRYSLAVRPPNYLLFACHFLNGGAQLTQGYRYLNWHYWGGKEANVDHVAQVAKGKVEEVADKVKSATIWSLSDLGSGFGELGQHTNCSNEIVSMVFSSVPTTATYTRCLWAKGTKATTTPERVSVKLWSPATSSSASGEGTSRADRPASNNGNVVPGSIPAMEIGGVVHGRGTNTTTHACSAAKGPDRACQTHVAGSRGRGGRAARHENLGKDLGWAPRLRAPILIVLLRATAVRGGGRLLARGQRRQNCKINDQRRDQRRNGISTSHVPCSLSLAEPSLLPNHCRARVYPPLAAGTASVAATLVNSHVSIPHDARHLQHVTALNLKE